jgi:hypothetical protein
MTDAPEIYVPKIDRRAALAWIGVAGATIAVGSSLEGCGLPPIKPKYAGGYGTDPKLNPPLKAPWPRILSPDALQAAAILADFILPATATAPSASKLGVPDFIDEWVSAPYPDQLKDRPIIQGGLAALAPKLLGADASARNAALAAVPTATDDLGKAFFKRFRALTVGAYYTTEVGMKEIGYIGNVARASDPGPSDEVKAALDARLTQLGL